MSKLIVFSAPSGSGKTTIVKQLMRQYPELNLSFSVSTTSRSPRGQESNGVDYYFIEKDVFKEKILKDEFVEWQEVYTDNFYGTYKSEVKRLSDLGKNILFDIDVFGAINIKEQFKEQSLLLFVQPPNLQELERRLLFRNTETPEKIAMRLSKAEYEMRQAKYFDRIIINDDLQQAVIETQKVISDFLKK